MARRRQLILAKAVAKAVRGKAALISQPVAAPASSMKRKRYRNNQSMGMAKWRK
jgi:hypothetical protein